jgi:hypothetical protein
MIKERKKKKEALGLTLYPIPTWTTLRKKTMGITLTLVTKKCVKRSTKSKFRIKTKLRINSKN